MKVLFLMLAFPDVNKSFNMYTSLVEEFVKKGHDVFVVAPQIPNEKTQLQFEKNIQVLRVQTLPLRKVNNFVKGISNLLLPFQYKRAIKKYYKNHNPSLIIIPTPPITLASLALSLKEKYAAKLYLVLKDIFPQNAVDLGFMNKYSGVYSYFRYVEKKLYKAADKIGCMSQGNISYILSHNKYIDADKLHVLENWQVLNTSYPNKNREIMYTYNLAGKFVVLFGGNMGKAQQLENVLTLAKQCEGYKDVVFLFLGDGTQKKELDGLIKAGKHDNVILRTTIPKGEFQNLVSCCDIGLISLNKNFTIPNIPSKMLDYFNLGIPVLASIDKATDFGKMLDEANAGLWSIAGDTVSFKRNFETLYHNKDLRMQLGSNGRKYFENRLTPDIAYEIIIANMSKA